MKKDKKSLAAFVGASIVTSLSAGVVNAAENPFVLKDMAQGYMQVAEVVPFSGQAAAPAAKPAEAAKPAAEKGSNRSEEGSRRVPLRDPPEYFSYSR